MSKYYGTLSSDKGRDRNKMGYHEIYAAAQTFNGSVTVAIDDSNGDNQVQIFVREDSGMDGFCIGKWPLKEFVLARKLIIAERSNDG